MNQANFEVSHPPSADDEALRSPQLRPADVYAPLPLDDTLEADFEAPEAYDFVNEVVRPAAQYREEPEAEDTILVAIGAGLVTCMLALVMMLFSGYGAL
jgi:Tfp pilus assembly protein FimV